MLFTIFMRYVRMDYFFILKKHLHQKITFLNADSLCIKYNNRVVSSFRIRSSVIQNSSMYLIIYDATKGAHARNKSQPKQNRNDSDQTKRSRLDSNYRDTISDLIDRISKCKVYSFRFNTQT